jgi:hypothetical protein
MKGYVKNIEEIAVKNRPLAEVNHLALFSSRL